MVDVALPDGGSLHCYIPLSAMGDPPPTKRAEMLTKGEVRPFVLVAPGPAPAGGGARRCPSRRGEEAAAERPRRRPGAAR